MVIARLEHLHAVNFALPGRTSVWRRDRDASTREGHHRCSISEAYPNLNVKLPRDLVNLPDRSLNRASIEHRNE